MHAFWAVVIGGFGLAFGAVWLAATGHGLAAVGGLLAFAAWMWWVAGWRGGRE